jgi:hypothetical protein
VTFCILLALLARDVSRAELRHLVDALGSDRVEDRDAATARLKGIARFGDPDLKKAARGSDREVALRAREVLRGARLRRESLREIGEVLEHAWSAFEEGDFDRSVKLADTLLAVDASFPAARELRLKALETGGKETDLGASAAQVRLWREDAEPLLSGIRLPPRAGWGALPRELAWTFWRERHPKDCECGIFRKLRCLRVDLDFKDAALEDILAFIRDFSGLNLVMDAKAGGAEPDRKMTIRVKDMPLSTAPQKFRTS